MLSHSSRLDPLPTSFPSLLSSLPLVPPHQTPTSIYHSILSSPHWISDKFTKLQTLGEEDEVPGGSHRVVETAYGSTGCVNAMDWEEGGEERLASAGDDTKICIWKPGYFKHENFPISPHDTLFPGYGLSQTIDTQHRSNIFSIKWAPSNSQRLFSAAGDCTARVYDLSLSSNSSLSTTLMNTTTSSHYQPHLSWSHHSSSACTRVITCHTDRVKRISTEPYSSDLFLTCSEDGTVRQHDLRLPHQCGSRSSNRSRFGGGGFRERNAENCSEIPLADYSSNGLRLYSMSLSKLQPHLFAVSGTSPFAYLHDRRMLKTPMIRDWSISPNSQNLTECIGESIVAVKMNPFDSKELIASYSEIGIYRFDIYGDSYQSNIGKDAVKEEEEEREFELIGRGKEREKEKEQERRKRNGEDEGEGEGEGIEKKKTKLEEEERESSGEAIQGDQARDVLAEIERVEEQDPTRPDDPEGESNEVNRPTVNEEEESSSSSDFSNEEPSSPFSQGPHSSVPLIPPISHYSGHSNSQTVKDVNFAFEGNLIVTGSDDGNFFAFEKQSEKCVGIFLGDSSVVNVLQPHPRLPFLAISGIDSTIKLFGPLSSELNTSLSGIKSSKRFLGNVVEDFEEIQKRNQDGSIGSNSSSRFTSGLPDALLRLIAARMNEIQQRGEGEEEGQGEGGRFRVVFGNNPGEDAEERNVDCNIM
ncbi:hypothetical protein JCM5350_003053 [Sporobolomyces pararoseus]